MRASLIVLAACGACLARGRSVPATPPAKDASAAPKRERPTRERFRRLARLHGHRALFIATAINPALAVFANDYTSLCLHSPLSVPVPAPPPSRGASGAASALYGTLFSWARLQPRLLFAIGAALRALQQTTVLQYVFDPGAGVGAGLNLLCLFTAARWPATLVLGWAGTKAAWTFLGARPAGRNMQLPIAVSVGGGGGGLRAWLARSLRGSQ